LSSFSSLQQNHKTIEENDNSFSLHQNVKQKNDNNFVAITFFAAAKAKKEGNGSCCLLHCNKIKNKKATTTLVAHASLLKIQKTIDP